ncbi:MAG: hypothetical protein JWL86_1494, partial [Rhizobium sp.]|nr:hypothetical protein [Rhizobium sp.]
NLHRQNHSQVPDYPPPAALPVSALASRCVMAALATCLDRAVRTTPRLVCRGWTINGDRLWIRIQLGHRIKIGLAWCFLRRQRDRRPCHRRVGDNGRRHGRLAGIQHNFFRPFVLGSDPYRRPVDVGSIRKTWRGLRQKPAGYQQKNQQRASDHHKISGYGHSR